MANNKYYYNHNLLEKARWLRNNATLSEVLLWQRLKGGQLFGYDFHRQKPLLNYIVDFYCKNLNLIIEIDGLSHDYKLDYDKQRDANLKSVGIHILRFDDHHVKKDIDNVVQIIVDWIGRHTTEHTPAAATPLIEGNIDANTPQHTPAPLIKEN